MCRPVPKTEEANTNGIRSPLPLFRLWPVSPWLVVAVLPFLPTWCYLNRGYTQWFHWNSFFFCLTQNDWHAKFLALQGLTVTLGWYSSLLYDWHVHSRFAHILYWNMPTFMTRYMMNVEEEVIYTQQSVPVMILAHLLDTIGHPILAYYFWKRSSHASKSLQARFSWSVLGSAYLLSRIWSIVHTWYNQGEPSLFYFGYDVYTILDRDAWLPGLWLPAYIAEGAIFACLVLGKLCTTPERTGETKSGSKAMCLDGRPPMLRHSTLSTISTAFDDEE